MKKVGLIFMSILIAFHLILPPDVAHANLATKPLTIAAKKAAKDIVKDTAVEMANQIVSEYLVKELLEGVSTDKGYSAVCMDGKKDNLKDCAPDKRAQIKTDLSQTDKKNLEKKVESVLERKTNTSSKWTKFLDLFIPLFLVSGAIEFISSALDGDILSFFDEIAQESLIESGLLKPLANEISVPNSDYVAKDFSANVESATIRHTNSDTWYMDIKVKKNKDFKITYQKRSGEIKEVTVRDNEIFTFNFTLSASQGWIRQGDNYVYFPKLDAVAFNPPTSLNSRNSDPASVDQVRIWEGAYVPEKQFDWDGVYRKVAENEAKSIANKYFLTTATDVNSVMNKFIEGMSMYMAINGYKYTFSDLSDLPTNPKPPAKVDYGKQTATDKIKDPDGKIKMKGINSFNFTYGDTHIYPSDQSKTGWKNKTTGEDITVVEDDVVVEDANGTDPPDGTGEDGLDKDKEKEKLEKESGNLGNLVTTRFPFSLPWDFMALLKLLYAEPMTPKWVIDTTDTKIPLKFDIDLKFLDPYIAWFRGFVLIGFIISVIFMHSRFMGGSK